MTLLDEPYITPKFPEEYKRFKHPSWSKSVLYRIRGGRWIVEDICEHGIGHPNKEWLMSLPEEERDGEGIHGCDKCCWRDDKFEEETERLRKIVEYYEMMIQ